MSEKAHKDKIISILFVDDDELMHEMLKVYLKDYNISHASTVDEAIEYMSNNFVSLVITDICMPGSDGLFLLNHIKKEYSDILVIMLTSSSDVAYWTEALQKGAHEFLLKPVGKDELLNAIENCKKNIIRWQTAFSHIVRQKNLVDKDRMIFVENYRGKEYKE